MVMEVSFNLLVQHHGLMRPARTDIVSSKTSTFPYDLDTLNHIAHFIEKVKGTLSSGFFYFILFNNSHIPKSVDEPKPKPNPYYTSTIGESNNRLRNVDREPSCHQHATWIT